MQTWHLSCFQLLLILHLGSKYELEPIHIEKVMDWNLCFSATCDGDWTGDDMLRRRVGLGGVVLPETCKMIRAGQMLFSGRN
jgi:hypothetical protein